MTLQTIETLEIAIDRPQNGIYPVRITTAAGEQARSTLVLPLHDPVYQELIAKTSSPDAISSLSEEAIITIGQYLYTLLLHGATAALFQSARAQASRAKHTVQIRLIVEAYDDLLPIANLPWEFMADDAGFPLVAHYSLVRTLPRTTAIPPITVDGPLRMLVVWALPRTMEVGYLPNIEAEVDAIYEQLRPSIDVGQLTLQIVPHASALLLEQTVREIKPHIIHFVTYGSDTQPALILEDDQGHPTRFSPRQLAIILKDQEVRLVVLNAFQGTPQTTTIFRSFGPALLNAEIPAIIGMQSSVQDTAGSIFSTALYRTLLKTGSIDQGVMDGRKASITADISAVNWGLTTLYLRAQDGVLFMPRTALDSSTSSTNDVLIPPLLRFDGMYQGHLGEYLAYLRLYADGTVITTSSTGLPQQVAEWFNRTHPSLSTTMYRWEPPILSFTSVTPKRSLFGKPTVVDYQGKVTSNMLRLRAYSHTTKHDSEIEYQFIHIPDTDWQTDALATSIMYYAQSNHGMVEKTLARFAESVWGKTDPWKLIPYNADGWTWSVCTVDYENSIRQAVLSGYGQNYKNTTGNWRITPKQDFTVKMFANTFHQPYYIVSVGGEIEEFDFIGLICKDNSETELLRRLQKLYTIAQTPQNILDRYPMGVCVYEDDVIVKRKGTDLDYNLLLRITVS